MLFVTLLLEKVLIWVRSQTGTTSLRALLYFDVDHFKYLNDTQGHQAGDRMLQIISEKLKVTLKRPDLIARLGGDEFAVVLADADREIAMKVAQRIIAWTGQQLGDLVDYPMAIRPLFQTGFKDLGHFRVGVLWAIGRLGSLADGHVEQVMPAIEAALAHDDAQVRGMAAWCLGEVGCGERLGAHAALQTDDGTVTVFAEGELTSTTVREIAVRALGA